MTIKRCGCGEVVTTKLARNKRRSVFYCFNSKKLEMLWFECNKCGSTLILKGKEK